jgi:hypothetical protein
LGGDYWVVWRWWWRAIEKTVEQEPTTRGLRNGLSETAWALVVNPVASKLRFGGVEQLTVTGRRTGLPRHVPVIPVQVDRIATW